MSATLMPAGHEVEKSKTLDLPDLNWVDVATQAPVAGIAKVKISCYHLQLDPKYKVDDPIFYWQASWEVTSRGGRNDGTEFFNWPVNVRLLNGGGALTRAIILPMVIRCGDSGHPDDCSEPPQPYTGLFLAGPYFVNTESAVWDTGIESYWHCPKA